MRVAFLFTLLMISVEVARAQLLSDNCPSIFNKNPALRADTVDTSVVTPADAEGDSLPLTENPGKLARPRFEAFHLVLGIGGMRSDLSELDKLDVNEENWAIPFLIYIYLPFDREDPSFYFTGGWEMVIGGGRTSFKGLFLYQNQHKILMGLGLGRSWFSYERDDLIIDASQSYPLLAIGRNLDPQRVDVLLTVPITSSLQATFEGGSYHIRPAGIQLSLLVSIRQ